MNPFKAYFVLAGLLQRSPQQNLVDLRHGSVTEIRGREDHHQYSNDSPASGGVVTGRRRASVRCSKA